MPTRGNTVRFCNPGADRVRTYGRGRESKHHAIDGDDLVQLRPAFFAA